MSDEKALLAAIWEHPHEDTPRLMYADWLQENGQAERAEFIRVQCELAQLDEWDDRFAAIALREQAILAVYADAWRAKVPKKWEKSTFHRGFLRLDLSGFEFGKLIQLTLRQLRIAPLARYHYHIDGSDIDAFLNWPGAIFQNLFAPWLPAPEGWADRVAACGRLRNVSEVAVISNSRAVIPTGDIRVILDSWADRHLTDLSLTGVLDDAAEVVARHPAVAKVRRLRLRGTGYIPKGDGLTATSFRLLGRSPVLGCLRELDLMNARTGDAGLVELARSPLLSSLRKLELASSEVSDEGAAALASSPGAANLRALNLYSNRIGPDGFRALARSPYLGGLTFLDIPTNPGCQDAGAANELRARFGHLAHFRC